MESRILSPLVSSIGQIGTSIASSHCKCPPSPPAYRRSPEYAVYWKRVRTLLGHNSSYMHLS